MLYPGFVVNFIVLLNLLKYANEACLVFFSRWQQERTFPDLLRKKDEEKEGEREREKCAEARELEIFSVSASTAFVSSLCVQGVCDRW